MARRAKASWQQASHCLAPCSLACLAGALQMAIAEFADALLIIPKTLAVNAAKVGQGTRGSCMGWWWAVWACAGW